jgi:hypothetical protein
MRMMMMRHDFRCKHFLLFFVSLSLSLSLSNFRYRDEERDFFDGHFLSVLLYTILDFGWFEPVFRDLLSII